MGVVYRARQLALDRLVAVKVLKSSGDEDEARFLREGRVLAALQCPQIVRVLDADAEAGRLWLVCELVSGDSLHDIHSRKKFPLARVLEIVLDVCRALEVAHARDIVHRDVKPENVIIADDGAVKLADFGLARALESDEALTTSGIVLGTPHYIAPEQVRGRPASAASDQYATAVMLYWLVSGVFPIDGANPLDILVKKGTDTPQPAHHVNAEVPRSVSAICDRALAIDPASRFDSISELAAELERARGQLAPPDSHAPEPAARSAPRRTRTTRLRDQTARVSDERSVPLVERSALSVPPAPPPRPMIGAIAVLSIVVFLLGLKIVHDTRQLAHDREPPVARPPTLSATDITFRRIGEEPCLEVHTRSRTALRVELESGGHTMPLEPELSSSARCFRVGVERILQPVKLRITSVEGSRTTTEFVWPGIYGQLDGERAVMERARDVVEAERLFSRTEQDLKKRLPELQEMWERVGIRFYDLAPVILDLPDAPLELKKSIYDALTGLRVLDRIARLHHLPGFLPPGVLGRTFHCGLDDGAQVGRERAYLLEKPLSVESADGEILPRAGSDTSWFIQPSKSWHSPRLTIELDTGTLAPGDQLWLRLGAWNLLVADDAMPTRPAFKEQAQYAYVGVDARLIPMTGVRVTCQSTPIPGATAHSLLRAMARVAVYDINR